VTAQLKGRVIGKISKGTGVTRLEFH
jgi:hypothetical protein